MANYIENYKSKMDWANVFVRTGGFPLDRSSMFGSYDDAVLYAKGDGSDSRGLGKTSYVGQIITVYEAGKVDIYKINEDRSIESVGGGNGSLSIENVTVIDGKIQEATADNIGQIIYVTEGTEDYPSGPYIVTGDGTVAKLGTTTASGDLAGDVASLQGEVSTLKTSIANLDTRVDDVETISSNNTNTISELQTTTNELSSTLSELEGKVTDLEGNVVTDVILNSTSVVVDGVATIPSYALEQAETAADGMASTYTFYQVVNDTKKALGTINIPKDQVLKSSSIETVIVDDDPYVGAKVGDKYIKFIFQNNNTPLYLPATDLVDIYKSGDDYIVVSDNTISLNYDSLKTRIVGEIAGNFATQDDVNNAKTEAVNTSIAYTNTQLEGYIQKDGDKVLSDNNFSDADVEKLGSIAEGAQVNVIEGVIINGTKLAPNGDKNVTISYADTLTADEENAIKAKAVYSRFNLVDENLASKYSIEFVDALPEDNASKNVIYILTSDGEGSKIYTQNIYYGGVWHVIGSTNFATKELASSTNDGLMSKAHFNKLENLEPISSDELSNIISGGTITE